MSEKLIVYVRCVQHGIPVTKYACNIRIRDGKAETIFHEILKFCQEWDIDLNKLTGLGTDGASVMTGRLTLAEMCHILINEYSGEYEKAGRINLLDDYVSTVWILWWLRTTVHIAKVFLKSSLDIPLFPVTVNMTPTVKIRWIIKIIKSTSPLILHHYCK